MLYYHPKFKRRQLLESQPRAGSAIGVLRTATAE
jgi:hypothetical protein